MPHPLPQSLPKECRKAEKIVRGFMESRNGLDGVIPRDVLGRAKGFAIFTVYKAGFFLSARAGSGIVIARLPDGSFSAPSAIGTAGMGFGGQAGAEMTEFLIVLNSSAAVKSFMSAGSLTIGGNTSVAVGPLGRNGELSGSLNTKGKLAAMYSYSKTKGLFGGLSIEGSVILERQDANCTAYGEDHVTSKMLLTGVVPPPPWASPLIETLERSTGDIKGWIQENDEDVPSPARAMSPDGGPAEYAFGNGAGSSRPKMKSRNSLFSGSADSVRKALAQPFASSGPAKPRHSFGNNPADSFLDSPKKGVTEASAGILHADDDYDAPYSSSRIRASDSPFSEANPSRTSLDRDLSPTRRSPDITNPFNRLHLEDDSATSQSRFQTHFESDFNPNEPKGRTSLGGSHQRQSSSISSYNPSKPSHEEDDDPFGIFAGSTPQPNRQAPPYSGLNYTSSVRSRGGRSSYDHDRETPPLTYAASSIHSRSQSISSPPISPTAQAFSPTFQRHLESWQSQKDLGERTEREVLYHPDISSPKPQRVGLGRSLSVKKELRTPVEPGVVRAIALFDYDAQESGDLSFKKGDVVLIIKKTDTNDDWWSGRVDSREGIFPANFVEVV